MSRRSVPTENMVPSKTHSRGSEHKTLSLASKLIPLEEEDNDLPQDITFFGYARNYLKKAPILGIMRCLPCL
jgi:hypothetical protein